VSGKGVNQDLGDLSAKSAQRRAPFFLESSRQRMPEIPPHLNSSITIIVIRERIVIKVLNRAASLTRNSCTPKAALGGSETQ
jgi:hypothetical protein